MNDGRNHFSLSTVKTIEDYLKVLDLRHVAYAAAGKIDRNSPVENMSDEFDRRSLIITASEAHGIVGTVRIIVHGKDDKLSYGRYFTSLPTSLPAREKFVEVSRLCVLPNNQGRGLAVQLAAAAIVAAAQFRPVIVAGATSQMLTFWIRCGFRPTGDVYTSTDLADIPHHLMILNTETVLSGKDSSQGFQRILRQVNAHKDSWLASSAVLPFIPMSSPTRHQPAAGHSAHVRPVS